MERGTLARIVLALAAAASAAHAQQGYEECAKYAEAVYRYEKTFHIPPQTVKVDQCAIKGVPFIVGGEQASSDEFPHMALLGYGDNAQQPEWACGGSLVSERFVLTAAHCIFTSLGSPKVVRLGELNLKTTKETNRHEDFAVAQSIPHPEYKDGVYYNDLGLLRLARDATFTASIRPACLHTTKETGAEAIASGWGYTDWGEASHSIPTPEITEHLMKVKLPIQKTEICKNSYKTLATTSRLRNGISEDSMVCAGTLQGGKDTCRGDSGGPLQMRMTTQYCMYSLVGVTSFGKGNCGTSKSPAIYTRVSYFVQWIESVVWPDEK
ncbi:Serine protease snake [Gryllus bimaculatus]|nr:Serine protease snake [Gryllus bimaculatus]